MGAAAVAVLVAAALSPFLPVGTARAAVLDRGAQLDGVVLAIALPLLVALVMVVAWFPVWRSERSRAGRPHERRAPVGAGWSPPASVGVGLALNGSARGTGLPIGAAVVGVALGALALVAGVGLVASLDRLLDTPRLYGAAWDLSARASVGPLPDEVTTEIAALDGVERVGGAARSPTSCSSDEVHVGGGDRARARRQAGARAHDHPGREPIRPLELAVGRLTLEQLGLDLGDEVAVVHDGRRRPAEQFTIVGEVVVNSTRRGQPGFARSPSPRHSGSMTPVQDPLVVLDLADGPPGRRSGAVLERRAAESGRAYSLSGPIRQPAVGNVARLRSLP